MREKRRGRLTRLHAPKGGARHDNSTNRRFNKKLSALYGGRKLSVLDIGCSGGAFVKSLIDDGNTAVGLEGSDYSRRTKRAAWALIPDNLFTCDVTCRFDILESERRERICFDVVTAWEVMEHIRESELPALIDNVKRHMLDDSLWIMSIATYSSMSGDVQLHVLRKPKEWWITRLEESGLHHSEDHVRYFNTLWVRGYAETRKDFHLAVCKDLSKAPRPPKEALHSRLFDRFNNHAYRVVAERFLH